MDVLCFHGGSRRGNEGPYSGSGVSKYLASTAFEHIEVLQKSRPEVGSVLNCVQA